LSSSHRERDIVCLLQGASNLTIIRLYKDHFAIVVIAAIPLNERGSSRPLELSKSITHFPRDFLLVWDLEHLLGESQDREEYETLMQTNNWVSLDKAIGTWNDELILGDLEEYKKAEERLREAITVLSVVLSQGLLTRSFHF
jgi:hypothetical protein